MSSRLGPGGLEAGLALDSSPSRTREVRLDRRNAFSSGNPGDWRSAQPDAAAKAAFVWQDAPNESVATPVASARTLARCRCDRVRRVPSRARDDRNVPCRRLPTRSRNATRPGFAIPRPAAAHRRCIGLAVHRRTFLVNHVASLMIHRCVAPACIAAAHGTRNRINTYVRVGNGRRAMARLTKLPAVEAW